MSANDRKNDDILSQEARLEQFSEEFSDILRRNLNELQNRVQEAFNRYEQRIQEIQERLNERENDLIEQQWKHELERRQWQQAMDKLKESKRNE